MKFFSILIFFFIHIVYTIDSSSDEESPNKNEDTTPTTQTAPVARKEAVDLALDIPSTSQSYPYEINNKEKIKRIKKDIEQLIKILNYKIAKFRVNKIKTIDFIKMELKEECKNNLTVHFQDFLKFIGSSYTTFFKRINFLSVYEYPPIFFKKLLNVLHKYNERKFETTSYTQKDIVSQQIDKIINDILNISERDNVDLNMLAVDLIQSLKVRRRVPLLLAHIASRREPKEIFYYIKNNMKLFQSKSAHLINYSLKKLMDSPIFKKEKPEHMPDYYSIEFNEVVLKETKGNFNMKKFTIFLLIDELFEYANNYQHLLYINRELMYHIMNDEEKLISGPDLQKIVLLLKDKLIMHYVISSNDIFSFSLYINILHYGLTKFIDRVKTTKFNRWLYEYKVYNKNAYIFNKIRFSSVYNFLRILTDLAIDMNYDLNKLDMDIIRDLQTAADDVRNPHSTNIKKILQLSTESNIRDIIETGAFPEVISVFILNSINNQLLTISGRDSRAPPVQTWSGPESRSDEVRGGEAYPGEVQIGNYFPNPAIGGGVYPEERSDEGESRDVIPRSIASNKEEGVYSGSGILPEPCYGSFEDASTKDRGVYPEAGILPAPCYGSFGSASDKGGGVYPEERAVASIESIPSTYSRVREEFPRGDRPGTSGIGPIADEPSVLFNYMNLEFNSEDETTEEEAPMEETNIEKEYERSSDTINWMEIFNSIDTCFVYQVEAGFLPKANYNPKSSLAAAFSAAIIFAQATGEYERISTECGMNNQTFDMLETMEFTAPLEGEDYIPALTTLEKEDVTLLELVYGKRYSNLLNENRVILANKLKFGRLFFPEPDKVSGTLLKVLKDKKLTVAGCYPVLVHNNINGEYWKRLLDFTVKIISAYYFTDVNAIEVVHKHDLNPLEKVITDREVHATEMYFDIDLKMKELTRTFIPVCEMEYYTVFKKSNGPNFFDIFKKIIKTNIITERMIFVESNFLYQNIKDLFPLQTVFVIQNNVDLMECIRTDVGIAGITTVKDLNNFDELGYVVHKLPITLSKGMLFRIEDED